MATPTISLSVPRIPRIVLDEDAMRQLTDGLSNALATLSVPEIDKAYELYGSDQADPPGVAEWEKEVMEPAVAEVAPAVAALLQVAIEKRLPWHSDGR